MKILLVLLVLTLVFGALFSQEAPRGSGKSKPRPAPRQMTQEEIAELGRTGGEGGSGVWGAKSFTPVRRVAELPGGTVLAVCDTEAKILLYITEDRQGEIKSVQVPDSKACQ